MKSNTASSSESTTSTNTSHSTDAPIASPGNTGVLRFTDASCGYHYCEFPDDVFFMESVAHNQDFEAGVAYVPVARFINGHREAHVYSMTATSTQATHVLGPVTIPQSLDITQGGEDIDLSLFGSDLSADGILYLCVFNRNSIVAVDLKMAKTDKEQAKYVVLEIPDVPAPNDVGLHPHKANTLVVAGGSFDNCFCGTIFTNAARGQVFELDLTVDQNGTPLGLEQKTVVAKNMTTLAGIEVLTSGDLVLSNLQDMQVLPLSSNGNDKDSAKAKDRKPVRIWDGADGSGSVWMSDNIDVLPMPGNKSNTDLILSPAYNTLPEKIVKNILERVEYATAGAFVSQLLSAFKDGEPIGAALRDPEVSLDFSYTCIQPGSKPQPVRLVIMECKNNEHPDEAPNALHFEIDLVDTRKNHEPYDVVDRRTGEVHGKRYFFNEQVTHAAHVPGAKKGDDGFIACVSFEQTRILMLKDTKFYQSYRTQFDIADETAPTSSLAQTLADHDELVFKKAQTKKRRNKSMFRQILGARGPGA